MAAKIPVAVLGATGSVGQRFIQLLDNHPWFEVVALTGSDRSIGMRYQQACHWILSEPMPEWAREMVIVPTTPEAAPAKIYFSALPTDQAAQLEAGFAEKGGAVVSNASAHRTDADVPILLPEVNPEHAGLVGVQRKLHGWKGCIVTNPNCTSTGLTVALKALDMAYGVQKAFVVSLQALSGAGYPGVSALDILDNVVPYIGGEEEKLAWEPRKMLGTFNGKTIDLAAVRMSTHTNRVAVQDGHIVCATLELGKKAGLDEIRSALANYQAPEVSADLPSTPKPVIVVREEPDRPQPKLDRMTGKGMTTVVGRLRTDDLLDLRLVVLSHNTIRGAAGGAIYNGELLVKTGWVQ
jgi:aspartate-semialdehyde dehydrogenase